MRTTFAVGRLTSSAAEIVLLEDDRRPSFPGPWTLRAVVRGRAADGEATPSSSEGRARAPFRDDRPRPGRSRGEGMVH